MNAYAITKFTGHWPVGTAATVLEENADMAKIALWNHLTLVGLPDQQLEDWKVSLVAVSVIATGVPKVQILCDGNY